MTDKGCSAFCWRVHRACELPSSGPSEAGDLLTFCSTEQGRSAGHDFRGLDEEVLALHAMLKEYEEEQSNGDSPAKGVRLGERNKAEQLFGNCESVLRAVEELTRRYYQGCYNVVTLDMKRSLQGQLKECRLALEALLVTVGEEPLERIERKLDMVLEGMAALDAKRQKRPSATTSGAADNVEPFGFARDDSPEKNDPENRSQHNQYVQQTEPPSRSASNRQSRPYSHQPPPTSHPDSFQSNPKSHRWSDPHSRPSTQTGRSRTGTPRSVGSHGSHADIGFAFSDGEVIRSRFIPEDTPPVNQSVTVIKHELPVTLEELYHGTTRKDRIKRKLMDRETGRKTFDHKTLEIMIDPGVRDGWKIQFKGVGDDEDFGQQDIHYIIREEQHPMFTRNKDDLRFTTWINLVDALCGTWDRISFTSLDGKEVHLDPPPLGSVTIPNAERHFRGLGMPKWNCPGQRGDLIVTFQVNFPINISQGKIQEIQATLGSFR